MPVDYEPIFSPEDEADVISALINVPTSREKIFECVNQRDFHTKDGAVCFRWLTHLWNNRKSLDDFGVQDALMKNDKFTRLLTQCRNSPWGAAMGSVIEASKRRGMQLVACTALEEAEDVCKPIDDTITKTHDAIHSADSRSSLDVQTTRDAMKDLCQHVSDTMSGKITLVPWGLNKMKLIRRYGGTIHVIGARPSVGKTALAVTTTLLESQAGIPVGLICMEMDRKVVAARYVSQLSGITTLKILDGLAGVNKGELDAYTLAGEAFSKLPLYLNCGRTLTCSEIRHICTDWVRNYGVRTVYIDYAQNIRHSRTDDFRHGVMTTLISLKETSQELDIPINLFAQLNREADGKTPRISNLKESGAFEEIAESVTLLDRPDADGPGGASRTYELDGKAISMKGLVAAIVAKQRNGPTGTVFFKYGKELMQFSEPTHFEEQTRIDETF